VLRDRVVSAAVMLVVFVVVNFFLPESLFRLCLSLLTAVAGWEWSRLSGVRDELQQLLAGAVLFVLSLLLWRTPFLQLAPAVALLSVLFWTAAAFVFVLKPERQLARDRVDWPALVSGAVLLLACFSFVDLLHNRGNGGSPWLLLYALSIVWVMDTGAYFSGKRYGKHKLAPAISPGKTWEGVIGGVTSAAILALLTLWFSSFAANYALVFVAGTLLAAAASVLGDLYESRLKRSAGMKDSSQLIKGHGGVLDRIDGVIAAVPVFGFAWTWL